MGLDPAPPEYEAHPQFVVGVKTFAALLCDLSRPEARDWWIQWGIEAQRERTARLPFDANLVSSWQALRSNPARLHEAVLSEVSACG